MKKAKKVLTVLLTGAILTDCIAMTGMTASADASNAPRPEQHIALRCWTMLLEENGIPFSEMGANTNPLELEKMLKEKDISATSFVTSNIEGMKELEKLMNEYGASDEDISIHFIGYMLGMKAVIEDDNYRITYDPNRPENADNVKKLLENGYTYNDERWEFDVEEYMLMHDYYPSGRYSFTTNVSSNLALSGSKLTCQSNITGNNKTTKITVTQYLEMRSGKKWEIVRAWSKTANAKKLIVKNNLNVISGSYRLRTVFNVWAGKEHETITKYSSIKAITSQARALGMTCDDNHYDVNGDGFFSMEDVRALQNALNTGTAVPEMDINDDGKVNVFDLVAIKRMLSDNSDNEN